VSHREPRLLVLSLQAPLASESNFHLPAVADQSGGVVAVFVSGRASSVAGRCLALETKFSRTACCDPYFSRTPVPRTGLHQRLPIHLLFRGRSLSVSCLHRPARIDRRRYNHHSQLLRSEAGNFSTLCLRDV